MGNQGAANALMRSGSDQLTAGLDKLASVAQGIGDTNTANWNTKAKQNTEEELANIANIQKASDLMAATAEGGALNAKTIKSKYGAQVDQDVLTKTLLAQKKSLMADEISEAERVRKAGLEKDAADLAGKKFKLDEAESAENIKQSRAATRVSLENLRGSQMKNAADAEELKLRELSRGVSAEFNKQMIEWKKTAGSEAQALAFGEQFLDTKIKESNGVIPLALKNQLLAQAKTDFAQVGQGNQHIAQDRLQAANSIEVAKKGLRDEFKVNEDFFFKSNKIDRNVVAAQTDTSSAADVQNRLIGNLQLTGKFVERYDTKDLGIGMRKLQEYAMDKHGVALSDKLAGDTMIRMGYGTSKWEYVPFINDVDPVWFSDQTVINEVIDQAKVAKDLADPITTIGASYIELQKSFSEGNLALDNLGTSYTNQINLDNWNVSKAPKYTEQGILIDQTGTVKPVDVLQPDGKISKGADAEVLLKTYQDRIKAVNTKAREEALAKQKKLDEAKKLEEEAGFRKTQTLTQRLKEESKSDITIVVGFKEAQRLQREKRNAKQQ